VVTRDLKYYLDLEYDVVISRLEQDGEVIWKAYSRDLDSFVFYGSGDTQVEAVQSFERTKRELFPAYLEEGREIPLPSREDKTLPSGRFLLRIDPRIHQKLVDRARVAKKSLNSYVDQVLVAHVTGEDILARFSRSLSVWSTPRYRPSGAIVEPSSPGYDNQRYATEVVDVPKVA
jgi:predicted HicB family RNase H-like nuclease